jgi:nucleotide-binding universal stress UspA family protein
MIMSYKTILIHLDNARNMDTRIQAGIDIAKAEKAHLVGVAPADRTGYFFGNPRSAESTIPITAERDDLREHAELAAKKFESRLRQEAEVSYEVHVTDEDAYSSIESRVRYCDLVILGQYDPSSSANPMESSLIRDIILGGGAPALIVPRDAKAARINGRALIAWNGSTQARRAVHDALPLLQRCEAVKVAILSPTGQAEEPGAQLQNFLARHGVSAELMMQEATYHDVQQILVPTVLDTNSDLLVMGGYGHSPLQQSLLGGVTRTMLHTMPVPVLMSH